MPYSTRSLLATTLILGGLGLGQVHAQEQEHPSVVADGTQVSIEYTLTLADGTVAETNVGGEALTYEQGASQILPALEQEILGMKVGESKHVSLSAAEGYGEVDPALFKTVPASEIPDDAREVGTQLVSQSTAGQQRLVRVHEVRGDEIVIDFNHPLSGKALDFDIKVLGIE